MTITIQIGNSDDKLTQFDWSVFYSSVDATVNARAQKVWFSGHSAPSAAWQNAAWVFDVETEQAEILRRELSAMCKFFKQDSIAWTSGATEFIAPCVQQ